jgi:hypothetical protein
MTEESSLGPRGLTIEQQNEIAAIQSQAASRSMQSTSQRFSVGKGETALYVGELSPNVNDDILKQHFTNAKSVHVCRDHVSGKSLGYAYVNFVQPEDCKSPFLYTAKRAQNINILHQALTHLKK